MDALALRTRFSDLTTPHVADAALRLGLEVRAAPADVAPLWPGTHLVGRARPARHCGSVDVFLEALERAVPGEVLVVDNAGREDEACVGDLVTLEVAQAGLAGLVVWGRHRDTADLRRIGLPVCGQGAFPTGPQRLDPRPADALDAARFGPCTVTDADFVLADDDGVLFLPLDRADDLVATATAIRQAERQQAARMALGTSLREQLRFGDYLSARAERGTTFRQHLRTLGGAVEE